MEISGKIINEEQLLNIPHILLKLFVFHLEISGNDLSKEHLLNIYFISKTFFVFHWEISVNDFNLKLKMSHEIMKKLFP